MRKLAYKKPKVSEVTSWENIYSMTREQDWRGRPDGEAFVYSAANFYDYFKIVADGKTKYFFGETAWWDWKRYLCDLGYPAQYA